MPNDKTCPPRRSLSYVAALAGLPACIAGSTVTAETYGRPLAATSDTDVFLLEQGSDRKRSDPTRERVRTGRKVQAGSGNIGYGMAFVLALTNSIRLLTQTGSKSTWCTS